MTKKTIVLSVIALLLGAVYIYFFTDWFSTQTIQITWQVRPTRPSKISRDSKAAPVCPVAFLLRGKFKLTSVKVVAAEEFATNKHAPPLWHLISDSNSPPTKAFEYGVRIPGMKPAVPRKQADPLEPEVSYLLMVEAGKIKGSTNFFTKEFAQRTPR